MNYNNKKSKIYIPILFSLAIIIGVLFGRYYNSKISESTFYISPNSNKINEIIKFVERNYVDSIDKEEIIETAIPKILAELDPHSKYIPASELKKVNEPLEGGFSGIGIQFNMLNDTLVVLQTIPNGPSEKVGIKSGDRIIVVDGDTVAGKEIPSDSIVSKLKGPVGTKVDVDIERKNYKELIHFQIIRDKIPLHSLDVSYIIEPGIGYLKLNKFSRTTYEEFSKATIDLLQEGMEFMILDLRGNGGGYLDAAVNIADQFLANNELIVYTQGHNEKRIDYKSTKGGLCKNLGIIVLIDETSASASEILAGAIQDNDRGTIIGRRSFGKGLVQQQQLFADGSALRLTTSRYYTPTGRCIQKPYEGGDEEGYYLELSERYQHGEYLEEDSIKFSDSLKYITPKGKVVYGGGGIMPDIFVPIDTSGITKFLIDIRHKGLIYKFALEYADKNRGELAKFSGSAQITGHIKRDNILKKFLAYVADKGVKNKKHEDLTKTLEILDVQLKAYVVRNILDDEEFYPLIEEIDTTLQKAVEVAKEQHRE